MYYYHILHRSSTWQKIAKQIDDNFNITYQQFIKLHGAVSRFCGKFNTFAEATALITEPQIGSYFYVGGAAPWTVYMWDGTQWVESGTTDGSATLTDGGGAGGGISDFHDLDEWMLMTAKVAGYNSVSAFEAAYKTDTTKDEYFMTVGAIIEYVCQKITALRLDDKYLRKDQDDSTTHTLTMAGAKVTGNAAIDGNATVGGTSTVTGKSHLKDDVAIGEPVKAEVSGTTSGATISKEGDIAARSLALSEFLEVPEIRFNRASVIVGTNIQSPCGGIIGNVYPITDENGNEYSGIAVLELGDDDIAGSIENGDLCWGYWHDVKTKSNNATEDYDSHDGIINYAGFCTVYFSIAHVYAPSDTLTDAEKTILQNLGVLSDTKSIPNNSTVFRYELRPDTNDDGTLKYKHHPFVGMHFGGRGSTTDTSRQGFTVSTPNYTATYQLVSQWSWEDLAKYIVRVSGRLDGFEAIAGYKPNTWTNHFGTVETNFYYRGELQKRDLDQYHLYITQASNGMLQPGEEEKVSIIIRGSTFINATKAFTVKVGDQIVTPNDDGEITLTYKYSDLTDELTRIPVVATYVATETKTYTLTGQISIRKLVDTITTMDISIAGDSLLALGETKKVAFRLLTNTGFDVTSQAWKWLIERGSFDTSGEWTQTDADKVWGARDKAKAFAQQSYTSDVYIMLTWSSNPNENDLDPDISVQATTFRITAYVGEEEIQETIEI